MAWLELHQELVRHRKTKRLARELKISRAAAVGHVTALWAWALDHAPDGDLSEFDAHEIAEESLWEKPDESPRFVEVLELVGFLDDGPRIHDWPEYTGRLISQREAQRERARTRREASANGTRTVREASASTQPNPTQQNRKPSAEKTARPRDSLFDALAEATDRDPKGMTRREQRACGTALADIRRATPDLTPAELQRRATLYRAHFPHAALTPSALANQWSACAKPPVAAATSDSFEARLAAATGGAE